MRERISDHIRAYLATEIGGIPQISPPSPLNCNIFEKYKINKWKNCLYKDVEDLALIEKLDDSILQTK